MYSVTNNPDVATNISSANAGNYCVPARAVAGFRLRKNYASWFQSSIRFRSGVCRRVRPL